MMQTPTRRTFALALAASGLLSACVVVPAGRQYGGRGPAPADDDEDGVVIDAEHAHGA